LKLVYSPIYHNITTVVSRNYFVGRGMDYSEFERSGTAPTRNSKTPPPTSRIRPKTRGAVNGTSELSDLNMSLKMEKRNHAPVANNDDPVEDFHFAIENWEKTRKFKQSDLSQGTNSRKLNSAYTKGDPVSAAYSSQFKPIKAGSPKASPRLKVSKAKAVAEIQAAYGLSHSSNTATATATGSQSTESTSQRKLLKEKQISQESERITNDSPPPRYGKTIPQEKQRSPETLQPHPPRSTPQRAQSSQQPTQPTGPSTISSSSSTQSKASYRRRSDQLRTASSSRSSNEISLDREPTKESLAVNVSPTTCDYVDDEDYSAVPFSLGASDSASVMSYSNYETDTTTNPRPQSRKLYLGGSTGSPRTSHIEFQSTLTGTASTTELILDPPVGHAHGGGGSSGMRAPRSAGSLPRHNLLSPELRPSNSSTELAHSDHSNSNILLSSPWHGNSTNFNERPPSRQRTAFPVHLADRENGNSSSSNSKRTRASSGRNTDSGMSTSSNSNSTSQFFSSGRKGAFVDTEDHAPSGGGGGMMVASNANDLMLESPFGRPPSRQKIAAQYLWGDSGDEASLFDQEVMSHKNNTTTTTSSETSPDGGLVVSPLLTPSISTGGISLIDSEMIYSRTSSSPSLPIHQCASSSQSIGSTSNNQSYSHGYDREEKSRGSLAPMYDPTADGFTQLENRSQSAPFKIRVRVPTSPLSPSCLLPLHSPSLLSF
jgi:hypothetical protein